MWNNKGLTDKRAHLCEVMMKHQPDIVLLTETKRNHAVNLHPDLSFDSQEYRVIKVYNTENCRWGLVIILKNSLRPEMVEVIWRQSHPVDSTRGQRGMSVDILVQCPYQWGLRIRRNLKAGPERLRCKNHRRQLQCQAPGLMHTTRLRKGALLHEFIRNTTWYIIHTPETPTFQVMRNRSRGEFGSSASDLIVSKDPISEIICLHGEIELGSGNFPALFKAEIKVGRDSIPRRKPKTLLQSRHLKESMGLI